MPSETNSTLKPKRVRIAIMWTQLSGYFNACIKELALNENVDLFVSNELPSEDAPYEQESFSWIKERYQWTTHPNGSELLTRIEKFSPDIILCSGWNVDEHRYVLKKFKNKAVRLISLDNLWRSTLKQRIGSYISRYYLHPICDALFVAGERQAIFARKLGFAQSKILRGVLSCDHDKFSAIYFERKELLVEPKAFVFIGRLVPEKGLDVLLEAYAKYRKLATNPWPLKCYGTGPLKSMLEETEGIELNGFCQPENLPKELLGASCLVLPSKFEPWALVVHEATSAGMAVICTEAVGASVHLVQKGYNGYIVETGSVVELTDSLLNYSLLSSAERNEMGARSYQMSLQFTPQRWARTLMDCAISHSSI